MGLGDQLIATGLAKGASHRGSWVALGDGRRIIWDGNSELIFRGNPNLAPPGCESADNLEWVPFYKGNRIYNRDSPTEKRWIWNYDFQVQPGELYFSEDELQWADAQMVRHAVVVEPHVPWNKTVAPNKDWGFVNYEIVAAEIHRSGRPVIQFLPRPELKKLTFAAGLLTPTFRHAAAALARASLFIGPEGGLHHAAAAVGIPAVVLFGGFIPPEVTGYATHTNLTGDSSQACGRYTPCGHCREAMEAISAEEVLEAASSQLASRSF